MDLYEAIRRRRGVRAAYSGEPVDPATLRRVLDAAHRAPSVGNTQPWDFVVVRRRERLVEFAAHVEQCRLRFAASLPPERRATFEPIRIEGIVQSGTGVVFTYTHTRGGAHVLGRQTVGETGRFSVALAIENFWLAATAEGLGVGWVSFYDPPFLEDFVGAPPGAVVGWLCVGPVTRLQETPDLERLGWRTRRPLDEAIHHERIREPE